jgi:hypothetical protein
MAPGSVQLAFPLGFGQQLWPSLPHSHWPPLHIPLLPPQVWPSLMQRFCQQHAAPPHFESAQHGWPGPPQAWQAVPKAVPAQTEPALQVGGSVNERWQHGWPGPPQATHIPPDPPGTGKGKPGELPVHTLFGSLHTVPQQGWLAAPQPEHFPALQVPPPVPQVAPGARQ